MRNNIELLMALGVDDAPSRNNINEYIKNLKGLQNVKVALEVEGQTGGKGFEQYDKQIKALQEQVQKLNAMLAKVGKPSGGGGGKPFDGFGDGIDKSVKSLRELENEMKALNGQIRISKNAQDEVYKVVTRIKDETGKIREFKYAPEFDEAGVMKGFRRINETINDLNSKDIKLNIKSALEELKLLEKQGRLTKGEYDELKKSISGAIDNKSLRETVNLMREMDREANIDGKIFKGGDKVFRQLEELETRIERIMRLNGNRVDRGALTQIREEMARISQMDLSSVSQVQKAMAEISRVGKSVTNLSINASDMKVFDAAIEKAKKSLKALSDEGTVSAKHIDTLYKRLANVPAGDLAKLEGHLKRINTLVEANKNRRFMVDGIEKVTNDVRKLEAEFIRYYELNKKYINRNDFDKLKAQIESVSKMKITNPQELRDAQKTVRSLTGDVKQFGAAATQASRNSMTVINALKVALERFPIWMASSTLFFGTVNTAKEFFRILVDIDSKLVSIQKVAGEADLESTFNSATLAAERFGQSISQVLDAYIEFARQGYKGDDLSTLADAGLVASNVGEISAQQASEYLTSALVQWNKETSEAMGIIDSWNEIANNYATTVEKLAQGHTRAGATAKAVGLEFDQLNALIGTLTARTKQSGSEIGNFIKAVVPRLLSTPAQDVMKMLNVDLTDSSGNMRDVIEVYTEIAEKSKNISESQRLAVAEGLAGKYHISRMQSLLDDLGSADSLYRGMYESSTKSAGSAMRENEIYMQSLEARINLVRVEFEKLAVAVGEAFLTDGMIQFMKMSVKMLESLQKITGTIGALPVAFGLLASAIMLVSRRANMLGSAMFMAGRSFVVAGVQTRSLSGALGALRVMMTGSTVAANTLKTAIRGLAASTVVGIVFVGIGIALEKLIGLMGDASDEAEDLASSNKEVMDSFKANRAELNELSKEYARLEAKQNSTGLDTTEMEEYRDIANQIGAMMPSLVQSEDAYGNKVLGSAEALKTRISLLEQQVALEEKSAKDEADKKRAGDIETLNTELDKANGTIDVLLGAIRDFDTTMEATARRLGVPKDIRFRLANENGEKIIKDVDGLLSAIEEVKKKEAQARQSGNTGQIQYYQKLRETLEKTYAQIIPLENQAAKSVGNLRIKYSEAIDSIIQDNEALNESSKKIASTFASNILGGTTEEDLTKVKEALESVFSDVDATSSLNHAMEALNAMAKATGDEFVSMSEKARTALNNLPKLLKDSGLSGKQVDIVMKALNKTFDDNVRQHKNLEKQAKATGKSVAQLRMELETEADMSDKLYESIKSLTTVYEELAGVSEKQIEYTDDMLFMIQVLDDKLQGYTDAQLADLATKKNLTAEEKYLVGAYEEKMSILANLGKIYPELLDKDGKAIALSSEMTEAIKVENEANRALLKAYELLREGKLRAEDDMTRKTIEKTTARLASMREEMKMIEKQIKAFSILSSVQAFGTLFNNPAVAEAQKFALEQQLEKYRKEIADLTSSLGGMTDSFVKNISAYEDQENASKNSSKATKEQTYQTDRLKIALDEVNAAIERQNILNGKYATHSQQYRDGLKKQLELEKKKLNILLEQEKVLKNQANGRGLSTTTTSTPNGTQTTTTVGKISGWGGKVTSNFGGRIDPFTGKSDGHRGIDIAAPMGTRLDANIAGRVIASGDASANKYHSSYGNIVVVQDETGVKHLYAHLQKAVAKIGDYVEAGTQIGNIGSTGRSTGSHLHYETTQNGKLIDPTSRANAARNGQFITQTPASGGSSSGNNIQQQIDQAKSDSAAISVTIAQQRQIIDEFTKKILDSEIDGYEFRKRNIDKYMEASESNLRKMNEGSKQYRKELDNQTFQLTKKKKINEQEIAFLKAQINSGKIGANILEEYTTKLHELQMANNDIEFALKETDLRKVQSYVYLLDEVNRKYQDRRDYIDNSLAYENLLLQELDTNSLQYTKSLVEMSKKMQEKQNANREELTQVKQLIASGQLYGEALTKAKDRVNELMISIKELQFEIQDRDWEIIVNIKTQSDEVVKAIDFEIQRADAIRKMYEQGSGDYQRYTREIIEAQKKLAQEHLKTRDALRAEANQKDISIARSKELTEMIRAEHMAYLNATLQIEEYNKQLEESNKQLLEDLANKFIDAYKKVIQERRDAHMRALEEEVKAETDRHNKVIKQLNDELDTFKRNVEERKRLIQRAEAERDYNMEIDDLQKQRNELQEAYNRTLLDDSNEAKKKRKNLQEQIDKIDKEIAEKRHDRDIELQLQGLDDQLELKEKEIEGKTELENEAHDAEMELLNKKKQYWEKHYNDLLNDERKFAQIREDIMSKNFEKILAEFNEYIGEMKATMPDLADTLDGTMRAVGMTIRQNLIDQLEEAIRLIGEFKEASKLVDNPFDDGWSSGGFDDGNTSGAGGGKSKLNNGDLQILLGKLIDEQIATQLTGAAKQKAHEIGRGMGTSGRQQGGTISKDVNFESALAGLTPNDMKAFQDFIRSQLGMNGGAYDRYLQQYLGTGSTGDGTGNSNPASKYGIGASLTKGDMQVMFAKYIRESLVRQTGNEATKATLRKIGDNMAAQGRANGSKISSDVTYDAIYSAMTNAQRMQLKNFIAGNTGIVNDPQLQDFIRRYAASLDTGGFMNWGGKGIDGKGGKTIIAHPEEVLLDKFDTKSLWNNIDVVDRAAKQLASVSAVYKSTMPDFSSMDGFGDTYIQFGDVHNATQEGAKEFAREFNNRTRRRRGN